MTDQQGSGPDQPSQPDEASPEIPNNQVHVGQAPQPPAPRSHKPVIIAAGAIVAVLLLCCGLGTVGLIGSDNAVSDAARKATPTPTTSASAPTSKPTSPAPTLTMAAPSPTTAAPLTPASKPRVINGRGDDVVRIPHLTALAVVVFQCTCTGNTVLRSDGPERLLVNEIGTYTGKRWINLEEGALTTEFEVQATGSWTLTIGTVDQLATKAPSGSASGKGDDVIVLGGSATAAKITHSKGQSNFVVHAYSLVTGKGGLLVNEIGGYSGTRPLSAPALVQVTADGSWTITPA